MSALIQWLRAVAPSREQLAGNRWLRTLAPCLTEPRLWQWSRRRVASGAAIGLFIGLLIPVAQILVAASAAVFLRANVPVAVAGTLLSNPLTVPPILFAAYHLGAWVTGSSIPAAVSLSDPTTFWENLGTIGMPLLAGLGITASCAAIVAYLLISQLWIWRVAAKRQRTSRRTALRPPEEEATVRSRSHARCDAPTD